MSRIGDAGALSDRTRSPPHHAGRPERCGAIDQRLRPASRASGELPRPDASARLMLATEPVLDSSGVAKSACASIYASPTDAPAVRRAPRTQPSTMLQSPPSTTAKRHSRLLARPVPRARANRPLTAPHSAPGWAAEGSLCRAGGNTSPKSPAPSRAIRPRSRRTAGALSRWRTSPSS